MVKAAFFASLCSGPAAFSLALLCAANHLGEQTKERLALVALITVLGGALAFACVVRARLPVTSPRPWLADFAVVLPSGWAILIVAFILYAFSQPI